MLIGGALVSVTLLTIATRRLDYDRIPQAAILAAAFFIASLLTIPVGPTSVHLMLNGLMGLILGWTAVPAILVALVMQALFFGYGGLLVLGVNCMNIALPALLCGLLFSNRLKQSTGRRVLLLGGLCGAIGVVLTGLLVSISLALSSPDFLPAAKIIIATYLPLMIAEGVVTAFTLAFINKVSPELLRSQN